MKVISYHVVVVVEITQLHSILIFNWFVSFEGWYGDV